MFWESTFCKTTSKTLCIRLKRDSLGADERDVPVVDRRDPAADVRPPVDREPRLARHEREETLRIGVRSQLHATGHLRQ